ncbi:MAG: S8 family serine peptidase [Bacteroidetes bacterium]|nr:S8 family serine peptidase [Bacteroidota bacterium]
MSQSLVNLDWAQAFGNPDTNFAWNYSKIDPSGNLVTIGNTLVSGEGSNLYLSVRNPNGTLVWETDYNHTGTSYDYGVGLTFDASGNIYVCGTTMAAPDSMDTADYLIAKYDSSGVQQWVKTYDGTGQGEDIATAITVASNGNVFVTGSSWGSGTDFDFATIRYTTQGVHQWTRRFDRQNHEDRAVWTTTDGNNYCYVTGASGTDTSNWDMAVLVYATNGTKVGEEIYANAGSAYDRPLALTVDQSGNGYITGTTSTDGIDYDITTLKLDNNFDLEWVETYDEAGFVDQANSITLDDSGNVYIAGFVTLTSGRSLTIMKYDNDGNLLWKKKMGTGSQTQGQKLLVDAKGELVVTGERISSTGKNAITMGFSKEGDYHWYEEYPSQSLVSQSSTQLTSDAQGRSYVTTLTRQGITHEYTSLRYDHYEQAEEYVTNSAGAPVYPERQLVVQFDQSAVDPAGVDKLAIRFASPDFFLTSQATTDFYSKVPTDLGPYTFIRIFNQLTTSDSLSITRQGDTIPVPHFWAAFCVEVPEGVDIFDVKDSLETLFPLVHYAHPNYFIEPLSSPNDSLYYLQKSLKDTSANEADINIEPAWEIETGKPWIKVGVFDTGLDWRHPDFGFDGVDSSSSVMVDGWDFLSNGPIKLMPHPEPMINPYPTHGTRVAGIIGAIRNNHIGVAGVAGGDDSINQRGVSLYGLRIIQGDNLLIHNRITSALDAIFGTAKDEPAKDYQYGLHIMNHSWGVTDDSTAQEQEDIQMLREVVRFANRSGVILLVARGNSSDDYPNYPAVYDDDWIINVGGSNEFGHYDFHASYGLGVDLVAPWTSLLIHTTDTGGVYNSFNGTSAATPHVSGVVGLFLSYLNDTTPGGFRCAQEDVEFILQKTARDIITYPADSGYDDHTGFGLLDAGAAFDLIKKPDNEILHFDSRSVTKTVTKIDSNIQVNFLESYKPKDSPAHVQKGTHTVDVYKIEATVYHNIPTSKTILYSWVRPSASTLFPLYDGNGDLLPHHKVTITDTTQNSATLVGYVYQLLDSTGAFVPNVISKGSHAYSLLISNMSVNTDPSFENLNYQLFPNPAQDYQTLKLYLDKKARLDVEIYDIQGRRIASAFGEKEVLGEIIIQSDVSMLSTGIYIYKIMIGEIPCYVKFIKN